MDETTQSGSSWESWFQGVAAGVADKYASATWVQPFELQKMRIAALGETGYYQEGAASAANKNGTIAGISPGVLLLGGAALLAVILLKD